MNENNYKTKLDQVREVLLKEWDPIGIGHELSAQDEYDSYAVDVLKMLEDKVSPIQIISFLLSIEHEHMRINLLTNEMVEEVVAHLVLLARNWNN